MVYSYCRRGQGIKEHEGKFLGWSLGWEKSETTWPGSTKDPELHPSNINYFFWVLAEVAESRGPACTHREGALPGIEP